MILPLTETDYLDALRQFTELEECTPIAGVLDNPRCWEIARQYNKSREQVAEDVGRIFKDIFSI